MAHESGVWGGGGVFKGGSPTRPGQKLGGVCGLSGRGPDLLLGGKAKNTMKRLYNQEGEWESQPT